MSFAHDLSQSNIMVAGAAGFVGSAITRELVDLGANVLCFDNFFHGTRENIHDLADSVTVVNGDALDESVLINTIRKYSIEYIINCIGDTFVLSAYQMPRRFFDINLMAALNVLKAAKSCGVKRTLYVSSTEVYGIATCERIDENSPLAPVNTYAVSKLAADRLCYTFAVEHRLPVVIARIFNCYGPRETHPYIVPEIIAQLNRGNELQLGNTKAERDFTYVHDTARALIDVLRSSLPSGDVVNVGSDCSYSVEWLVYTIARIMQIGEPRILKDPGRFRHLDIDKFRCNNEKLKRYTNWTPRTGMIEGLSATIQWFRDNGCRWSWEHSENDVRTIEGEESFCALGL